MSNFHINDLGALPEADYQRFQDTHDALVEMHDVLGEISSATHDTENHWYLPLDATPVTVTQLNDWNQRLSAIHARLYEIDDQWQSRLLQEFNETSTP
jgi:hypothetical protein